MQSKPIGMQLPQHIIDLVGTLYDQGLDDEAICFAALQAWQSQPNTSAPTDSPSAHRTGRKRPPAALP